MAGLEGKTLNRYELQYVIGKGGMADVYLAYDPRFDRDVAVKIFKRDDEDMLRRFIREARLMASLRHPHLMPVYDAGEALVDGVPLYFIVMPVMAGGSLRARIRTTPLSLKESCRYLRDIASALDYIHSQGIIHRDIKSSNVLLNAEGECYLSDFGIARMETDATQLTSTGNVLGTVDYVAPELFEPNRRADAHSDLYSLGILLYEMVTGQLPFTGENQLAVVAMHMTKSPPLPRSIVQNLSPAVERVILRGLEKRPEMRYESASALAEAFCSAISARPREAAPSVSKWDEKTLRDGPLVSSATSAAPQLVQTAPPAGSAPHYPVQTAQRQTPAYPVPATGRKRSSPQRTRALVVTIIALVALLAVLGPMVYIAATHLPGSTPTGKATATSGNGTTSTSQATATPDLTATARAAGATATAQTKNATATAIVAATATVQAHASATAGVIQTATTGNPSYTDSLNNASNPATQAANWDQTSHCLFQPDGYHVVQKASTLGTLRGCLESGNSYSDMTATVEINILSGHSGGLFFHVDQQVLGAYAGYLFEIDSQGNFKISRSSNFSTGDDNATLQNWTSSPALKAGNNVKNTLQLVVRSGNLAFYANNQFLATFQDTTFSAGLLAFLATTSAGDADANVVYSNLKVLSAK